MKSKLAFIIILFASVFIVKNAAADNASSSPASTSTEPTMEQLKSIDSDNDGLTDYDEVYVYHTDPNNSDTDKDGFKDGDEVKFGFDPNTPGEDRLQKEINVDIKTQTLTYFLGPYQLGQFLISTGVKNKPTPPGDYSILKKIPVVEYKGVDYDFKNTRWNMMFKQQKGGNLYIHGAYWHNNFGKPMSHGCVNVSYANIESLYNWADVGTKVVIK